MKFSIVVLYWIGGEHFMRGESITAKINSIEAQLEILKFSDKICISPRTEGGLRSLKGFLKGKTNFNEMDFEEAKIKFKEKL